MTKFNNGVVYVKKISPETVLDDYSWLIDKAKLNDNFEKDITTFLKVNIIYKIIKRSIINKMPY